MAMNTLSVEIIQKFRQYFEKNLSEMTVEMMDVNVLPS